MRFLTLAFLLVVLCSISCLALGGSPSFSPGLRMPEVGPIYIETLRYMNSPDQVLIWEPYNTVSAILFAVVAIYWMLKIRRHQNVTFFWISMVFLLIGSIGGTLYKGLRSSR